VAFECEARAGLHINEDLFYPEVLDPQTGEPVPAGTVGELVLTSLAHEALPLLRYRTGDLTALWPGGCSCGRPLRKMNRIMGRTDDMPIVAGVNFYPSQVEQLILGVPGANGQYQIWLSRDKTRDRIEVRLEVEQEVFANANAVARVAERAAHILHDNIGIRMTVSVVEPGSIERSQGKARRVFDQRRANVMRTETVQLSTTGSTAAVMLNRPEVLNAANAQWMQDLNCAVGELEKTKGLRVVVMAGAGTSFCTGIDLHALATGEIRIEWFRQRGTGQSPGWPREVPRDR
jgi:hypothetical protein